MKLPNDCIDCVAECVCPTVVIKGDSDCQKFHNALGAVEQADNTERDIISSHIICDYCVNHSGIKCDVDFPNCFSGRKLSPVS